MINVIMKKFFIGIFGGIIVAAVVVAAAVFALRSVENQNESAPKPGQTPLTSVQVSDDETPKEKPVNRDAIEKKKDQILMAKYEEGADAWINLYLFDGNNLSQINLPEDADRKSEPAADPNGIYYFSEKITRGRNVRSLKYFNFIENKEKLISDSTPLVEPRSVFVSRNGTTVAFFLDSLRKRGTEIWTFDAGKDRKRVSLERLTMHAEGPFWDANGGFIVRDGEKIFRGTSEKPGGDILPVKLSPQKILSGRSMLPSPGGTQVVYLQSDGNGGAVLKVWDLKENTERDAFAFKTDKVNIIGWNSLGSLSVLEEGETVKIWNISKNSQDNFILDDLSPAETKSVVSSVTLSDDGEKMAYIKSVGDMEKAVVRDMRSNIEAEFAELVKEEGGEENDESMRKKAIFKILSYLRVAENAELADINSPFPLAREEIIGYVMQHVRVIAEAPSEEPVTAQRVLFTKTQDTVYVDYLVGTTIWRRLVRLDGEAEKAVSHKILGVFAPVSGEWKIAKGSDLKDPQPTEMYEFNSDLGKWIKKDLLDIRP